MSWFSFGKKEDPKGTGRSSSQLVVSSESIAADGKPIDLTTGGTPVDWNAAMVVKWAGPAPALTDRLFLSPGVSALVNWAFTDAATGDHFGFSRIDGPFGGRFIEVCKASNPAAPSESAQASSLKADVYFLSLSGTYNVRFGIGDIRVIEPELPDHPGVPTVVRGEYVISIGDIDTFLRLNRLQNFNIAQLLDKIRNAIEAVVVRAVSRAPMELGVPLTQISSITLELSQRVQTLAAQELEEHFGIVLKKVLLKAVEVDVESPEYMTVFELLGMKGQKAAEMKGAAELERLASRLTAETRLNDIDLDKKVDMADLLSGVESAKAREAANQIHHELNKNRDARSHQNEIDEIRREIELEKERAAQLGELETLKAQLSSSNRISRSELDLQAELAEMKAKLEAMKAGSTFSDAQHVIDTKERERAHDDALMELRRQKELQQLAMQLHVQQQRHLISLQEIELEIAGLQRSDAIADARQQAEIAKLMIEVRSISDNAAVDTQVRERQTFIDLHDIEDLKRRQREVYQQKAVLEAQHEYAEAHGKNLSAQLEMLKVKLEVQKLESERLRVAAAVQTQVVKKEPHASQSSSSGPIPGKSSQTGGSVHSGDSASAFGKQVVARSDAKLYSLRTADGKVNDYTVEELLQLINLNVIDNVFHPTLPLDHKLRMDE